MVRLLEGFYNTAFPNDMNARLELATGTRSLLPADNSHYAQQWSQINTNVTMIFRHSHEMTVMEARQPDVGQIHLRPDCELQRYSSANLLPMLL